MKKRVAALIVMIVFTITTTALADTKELDRYQFIRTGYFCTDKLSSKEHLIFNRTCPLKSSFNQ